MNYLLGISGKYLNLLLVLLGSVFMTSYSANAQLAANGTESSSDYITMLTTNLSQEKAILVDTLNPKLHVLLHLQVFVLNSVDGKPHFDPESLNFGLSWANGYFSKMGVSFKIAAVHAVPEYEFGFITYKDSTQELRNRYAREDYINLFLVDSIMLDGFPCYGYTTFPDDSLETSIFLAKEYAQDKYLTTLLGNFFGLLNTHETIGGVEYVRGDNCAEAGDYICETYADPNLLNQVDEKCHYIGKNTDPRGDYYVPTVSNLMSESLDACKCLFTYEQYRRMKYYYMNYRAGLR